MKNKIVLLRENKTVLLTKSKTIFNIFETARVLKAAGAEKIYGLALVKS